MIHNNILVLQQEWIQELLFQFQRWALSELIKLTISTFKHCLPHSQYVMLWNSNSVLEFSSNHYKSANFHRQKHFLSGSPSIIIIRGLGNPWKLHQYMYSWWVSNRNLNEITISGKNGTIPRERGREWLHIREPQQGANDLKGPVMKACSCSNPNTLISIRSSLPQLQILSWV